jgi:hypothetical protein
MGSGDMFNYPGLVILLGAFLASGFFHADAWIGSPEFLQDQGQHQQRYQ